MKNNRPYFIAVVLFVYLGLNTLSAQNDSLWSLWAEFLEEDPHLLERIQELLNHPININTAEKEDLLLIPFLSAEQADSILAFRSRWGKFKRKTRLRSVLEKETYRLIRPFVTIKALKRKRRFLFIHKTYFPVDISQTYQSYAGNRLYDYNKLYYRFSDRLRIGLVTQKDAGEASFFDYFSGFAAYERCGWSLLLGKQYLEFGQGLIYAAPFSSMKSAAATSIFTYGGIRSYPTLSTFENGGLFGARLLLPDVAGWRMLFFLADNYRDAQFSWDRSTLVAFDFDGYHRTESEMEGKDRIKEWVAGAALARQFTPAFYLAFMLNKISYRPDLNRTVYTVGETSFRRTYFQFSGNQIQQGSLYLRWHRAYLTSDGEFAFTRPGHPAVSVSLFLKTPSFRSGIKFWQVPKDFQSPYGRIFDDAAPFPRAQQGFYLALTLRPVSRLTVNGYHLFQKDLWRTYFDQLPHWKHEWLVQFDWKSKPIHTAWRIRRKQNEEEENTSPPQTVLTDQWLMRLQFSGRVGTRLRWRVRWEGTTLQPGREKGSYIFQELSYRSEKWFSFWCRTTFFRTDSYAARLYEYENDLPGSFANFPLYGEGFKWYFLIKFKAAPGLSLWLKYRYLTQNRKELNKTNYYPQVERKREIRIEVKINR